MLHDMPDKPVPVKATLKPHIGTDVRKLAKRLDLPINQVVNHLLALALKSPESQRHPASVV